MLTIMTTIIIMATMTITMMINITTMRVTIIGRDDDDDDGNHENSNDDGDDVISCLRLNGSTALGSTAE